MIEQAVAGVRQDVAVLQEKVENLTEWKTGAEHRMTELEKAHALSVQNQTHILEGLNDLKKDVKSHMVNSRTQYDDLRAKVVVGGTIVAVVVFFIQSLPIIKGLL